MPNSTLYEEPVLIISDKGNNCIRKIFLESKITTTLAGKCGESGFLDGPYSINRFSSPDSIGVDDAGIIFVYDLRNAYMRIINNDGYV